MAAHHMFYISTNLTSIWFDGLSANNIKDFAIVCAIVGVVCFLKTCLSCLKAVCFSYKTITQSKLNHSLCFRIFYHIAGAILTLIDCALGYMLMLAFMVGNLWLCVVIVGVSTLAYFITSWSRIPLQKAPKNRQRVTSEESENEGRDTTEMTAFLANPAAGDALKHQKSKPELLPPDQRYSMEASHIAALSTFQRDKQLADAAELETVDEKAILLARPDIIASQEPSYNEAPTLELQAGPSTGGTHRQPSTPPNEPDRLSTPPTKDRSDSNPLLEKYPVLRFHNIDIQDTSPAHKSSKGLEFDELDKLIKDLQQS